MVDPEQVTLRQGECTPFHLVERHATDVCGGNERSNTCTGHQRWPHTPFMKGPQHTDMGKTFKTPTAEYERDAIR